MMIFRSAIVLCVISLFVAGFLYYPKWKQSGTEATISWDASGYYMYLPAFFIYKDIKKCNFKDEILKQYGPTPDFQQAYLHPSGNYVMKYSIGQALQYLPAFFLSHIYTSYFSSYPADGFSRPYQLGISLHAFIIAVIGIFFLAKILLEYFTKPVVATTLVSIVVGSNYLDYAAINGAMTHNGLFTIYSLLIWVTIRYYKSPTDIKALAIGVLVGIAALTRPSEIISIVIPFCWGLNVLNHESIKRRLSFFKNHLVHIGIAGIVVILIGGIQLVYWKYATGEWIVYSYQDQGFSWLRPHLWEGIFSYKSGWITYSPIFVLIVPGFIFLWKEIKEIAFPITVFTFIFIYIAFAWDIWWYGGSLGQRAMVQSYPIIAFPLAAFISKVKGYKWQLYLTGIFISACIAYNLWLTHHAHRGGLYHAGQMTKEYFWKTFGKNEKKEEYLKLLDTDEEYTNPIKNARLIYHNDFEKETSIVHCNYEAIEGKKSICLTSEVQYSPEFRTNLTQPNAKWIRTSATIKCINKEWEVWKMAQFITKFYSNGIEIKSRGIRVHRLLHDGEIQEISYETKIPKGADSVGVYFWNAGSDKVILIDNLRITLLD